MRLIAFKIQFLLIYHSNKKPVKHALTSFVAHDGGGDINHARRSWLSRYGHSKQQLGWINGEQVDLRLNLSSELQFNFNEIIMLSQFPSFLIHEGVK